MGDISDLLPKESAIVKAIYEWHESKRKGYRSRSVSASSIGEDCERKLWYAFRHCSPPPTFSGRMLRLFETGSVEEARFTEELRGIGCEVIDIDPKTMKQIKLKALGGHFVDKPDAMIHGLPSAPETWHVGEYKTHNASEFKKLQKQGVKESHPKHYWQCMSGMVLAGAERALYLAKNKNTDELYVERIRYNANEAKWLTDRAERIIRAQQTPMRSATRPDSFGCKFCDAKDLCFNLDTKRAVPLPFLSCRQCCHATPEIDEGEDWARWHCSLHKRDLSWDEQDAACEDLLLLPSLVGFAEATDAGDEWIEFTNTKDGAKWQHGKGEGQWSAEELIKTPGPLVGHKAVQAVKTEMGATVVGQEDTGDLFAPEITLVDRYPPEDCRLVWEGEPSGEGLIAAFLMVREVLGLASGDELKPSDEYNTDKHEAVEFGNRVLYVNYKADNYAAIWEGLS